MARYEMLNNIAHRDLRVSTRFSAGFGDAVAMVPAYPTEFAELQREYPIFFRKTAEGEYQAVVLLGLEKDENLFLEGDTWAASYIPGAVARGPFLIGFQEQQVEGALRVEPVIHVDMDHPRVAVGEGQPLFLQHGGNSPYLEYISDVLRGINDGTQAGKTMFAAFDAAGLFKPMELALRVDENHAYELTGLHGIDRERLTTLPPAVLQDLHRAGWLEGAYLVMASLYNIRRLIAGKQRRLRERDGGIRQGQTG